MSERSATDYYAFTDAYDEVGPQAMAWLLAENLDDYEWAILGHMLDPFSGNHQYYGHSKLGFKITEAV